MSQRIFLKIFKNDAVDRIVQQSGSEEQVSIGHDPEVSVCLKDTENVSPWHALIEKRGDEYFASDLGSSQGTLLNNKELLDSVIQHGDVLEIGIYKIEFYIGSPYVSGKTSAPSKPEKSSSKEAPVRSISKKATQKPAAQKKASAKTSEEKKKPALKSPRLKKKPIIEETMIDENFIEEDSSDAQEFVEEDFKELREPSSGQDPAWSQFIPRKSSPKTFAPPSVIKDLDENISPGAGTNVEVIVAWGNRILAVHHSSKEETITIGSSKNATIQVPNLVSKSSYTLVERGQVAQILLKEYMTGKIITPKKAVDFNFATQKGIISSKSRGKRVLSLGQNEVVRVNLHPMLRVYIRYSSKTTKPEKGFFFDMSESELIAVGVSICLTLLLFFYLGIYLPQNLKEEEIEKETRFATIVLKPPAPPKPRPRIRSRVKKATQSKKARTRQKAPKVTRKQPTIVRSGNPGRIGGVKSNPKPKTRVQQITSARSGGSSIKAKKSGSTGQTPKVNPNEVGLLGVFGKSGVKKQLDKAQSAAGVLAGLADRNTGYTGNSESYSGEGIGTKFKSSGASGKGSSLVGISKISTRGRGGRGSGTGRGGDLGTRGRLSLSFGAADTDVAGGINRDVIDRVLKQNQPQLKACHSMVLQSDSSAVGRLSVNVSIVSDKVVDTGIKRNQSRNQRLADCVMSRIRNWRFPGAVSAGDKGIVTFHFVFNR